tara:strand:- start:76 stop:486 length:411 start_codon:yes stop_codon:yes gene_type:complete
MKEILAIQTRMFELECQMEILYKHRDISKQRTVINEIYGLLDDLLENSYETKKDKALDYIYEGARLINTHYLKHGREKYVREALENYKKGIDIYNELPKSMRVQVRDEVDSSDFRHCFNEVKLISTDIERHLNGMI